MRQSSFIGIHVCGIPNQPQGTITQHEDLKNLIIFEPALGTSSVRYEVNIIHKRSLN